MPITAHLEELRKRILYSVVALTIGFIVCFQFSEPLLAWLQIPLTLVLKFTSWSNFVANIPGIEISIITNFLMNEFITFRDRRSGRTGSFLVRLLKYNVTALAGAAINYAIFLLLAQVLGWNELLSNFIGIVVAYFIISMIMDEIHGPTPLVDFLNPRRSTKRGGVRRNVMLAAFGMPPKVTLGKRF